MDKSWMTIKNRLSKEYRNGVNSFVDFAVTNLGSDDQIRCPCLKCMNVERHFSIVVAFHLIQNGIAPSYKTWVHHGETIPMNQQFVSNESRQPSGESVGGGVAVDEQENQDDLERLVNDYYAAAIMNDEELDELPDNVETENVRNFDKLMKDAHQELYPGCKFTLLSFVIKLLHVKVLNKWSNKSFDALLGLLKELLPTSDQDIPGNIYEAKKFLRDLGLGYVPIHACKNDCALFWKENADLEKCPVCEEPRYKLDDGKGKKIPHKILRYFPLTPRLQRFYMSSKTCTDMRWHKEKRVDDGVLRHPADGKAWKHFDRHYPEFARDARNVRLGLATDGFNPFGNMSNSYSLWPVIVMPYNLPPWKCMKQPYSIMSLLIPGPIAPGRDIDVYLRPLIEELKELWERGAVTYDASTEQTFRMRVAVMWTINDFPAYGNLSGWTTKGYLACPICNEHASSQRLRSKLGYVGARRWLPKDHPWRRSRLFDGKVDHRERPIDLTGEQILQQMSKGTYKPFGKHPSNKRKRGDPILNWTKKSIFFELPYWEKLLLRHNLDVMHIEKNICEALLGILLSIDGKNKDTEKARQDLEDMRIRLALHLKRCADGSFEKPSASYTLSPEERHGFYEFLKSIKYPDGYAANISRCVSTKGDKLTGLKSHDCHVLLQRLLPIGMRGYLLKDICITLTELGNFFQEICSKTLRVEDLEKLQDRIVLILCKMEKIFPPAFFDVMVHLAIHLPHEAMLGGPVQYRWMYPIERLLGTLKGFVTNRAYPEGSISEAYIVKEP
ncbi:hypothetical protein RHSIM_Rhsim09G0057000 [Rhododendron simsii]|uniref:Transposase n=1 Tax=Rhododendron simsii TaxID=118357 RepID=A0A834GG13_RHOSS|nr:hypothetical protein RHSIM_Rhsim09G0057000 [Rhododendron simsii]